MCLSNLGEEVSPRAELSASFHSITDDFRVPLPDASPPYPPPHPLAIHKLARPKNARRTSYRTIGHLISKLCSSLSARRYADCVFPAESKLLISLWSPFSHSYFVDHPTWGPLGFSCGNSAPGRHLQVVSGSVTYEAILNGSKGRVRLEDLYP